MYWYAVNINILRCGVYTLQNVYSSEEFRLIFMVVAWLTVSWRQVGRIGQVMV